MSLKRHLSRGLRVLTNRRGADSDVDDELRHYIDQATAAYIRDGLPPDEAARAARRDAGSTLAVREQVRDAGWESGIVTCLADFRLAARMLRKSPVFTLIVVGIITIGTGAVTTIFSAMNAVLLRPLPGVDGQSRLVALLPERRDGSTVEQGSYGLHTQVRDRAQTLESAAWGRVALTLAVDGAGAAAAGNMVSGNYFDLLGVRPALGRLFTVDDNRVPGGHSIVVISHALWTSRFGGASDVIGRAVTLNGHPFSIIGVAPRDFAGIYTGMRTDAWVPLMMQPQLRPRSNLTTASWLWMFGRLRGDTGRGAAEGELRGLMAARAAELPESSRARAFTGISAPPLTGFPGGEGRGIFSFMSLLLGAAALVLAIAGVNVATMLSARYVSRQRELAVRASLGAGRGRLLRHLLTEVLTLFALGAFGGYAVAVAATSALEQFPLPQNIPLVIELSPDIRVFAFALAVSLAAGLLFGIAPALRTARANITDQLRTGSAGAGTRRTLMSRALIVGQLAFSLVLLVSAGLFLRALEQGQDIERGFDVKHVSVASLQPEAWGYDPARARRFYADLLQRVENIPGVTSVSFASRLPLMKSKSVDDVVIDGEDVTINHTSVAPAYFDALTLPVVHGRAFTAQDGAEAAPVSIVNETFAARVWPGASPLGRTFRYGDRTFTIVGVARDAKYAALDESVPLFAYFSIEQMWQPTQSMLVRTSATPELFAQAIRDAVLSIDPQLPPPAVTTLERATDISLLPQRAAAIVTAVLGGAGLLLVAVGLYGLMACSVGRRTREMGIRLALGARRPVVLRMLLGEGMRLAGMGITAGLVLSALATRMLAPYLFDVSPLDSATFGAMTMLFVGVALAATWVPARRAASADPLTALKTD